MKILADASLPNVEQYFQDPFRCQLYSSQDELCCAISDADILLCRSTTPVNDTLLDKSHLRYVATASSGTDHIDKNYLANRGIDLIDGNGCNAHAVVDYVLSSIAYLQNAGWVYGPRVGIIGLGAVGSLLYKRLIHLGFDCIAYDPYIEQHDTRCRLGGLDSVLDRDIILIHANLHNTAPYPSYHLLNRTNLQTIANQSVLINAARGDIVAEQALLDTDFVYCTDVFSQEPDISAQSVGRSTLCTPHIAGHSVEAKQRMVAHVAEALYNRLDLNFPKHLQVPLPHWQVPNDWQKHYLTHYNPEQETNALKSAQDTTTTFLQLRKAHHRHEVTIFNP